MSTGTTIAFSHKGGYWKTRYSFAPWLYFSSGNDMFSSPGLSFQNGSGTTLGWKHNSKAADRNTFYGDYYDSSLTIVSNYNPSQIKVFNSMSIESNYGSWKGTLETNVSGGLARLDPDYQQANIRSEEWKRKESISYRSIPRSAKNSNSNLFFVGTLSGENIITGQSYQITPSSEAFPTGRHSMVVFSDANGNYYAFWRGISTGSVWGAWSSVLSLTSQDIDDPMWPDHPPGLIISDYSANNGVHSITFQAEGNGDSELETFIEGEMATVDWSKYKYVYVASDPRINGDQMRGNYLKMTLETDGTSSYTDRSDDVIRIDDIELYAVNVDFMDSGINHSLG